MFDIVEAGLLPMRERWDDIIDSTDSVFVNTILQWAWNQSELQKAVRDTYRLKKDASVDPARESVFNAVQVWLSGGTFLELAAKANLPIDDALAFHSSVISFTLQVIVEQGIALMEKLLKVQNREIALAVVRLPEHLR